MKKVRGTQLSRGWGLLLGLGLLLTPALVGAGELTKFTGYTRPGIPTASAGPIQVAGDKAAERVIGATVYFKVFERGGDDRGDPWGTGMTNLDRAFVAGEASRGRTPDKLDTTARYLYLYQVVNDSYRPAQVKSVAIRLLVPPHLITSWGHFAEKREKEARRGAGFAMLFDNPEPKNPKANSRTLPLSTEHPGVLDDVYRDPAPYFYPPRPYSLAIIQLNNKPAPLTNGEDTGREPERVVLQSMFNFEGAPNWLVKDRVPLALSPLTRLSLPSSNLANPYYNPASPLMPAGTGGIGMAANRSLLNASSASSMDGLRQAPAVVAYWNDEPLLPGVAGDHPGQRSTVFGFTSNFPPVYEDVRVRGDSTPPGKGAAAPAADTHGGNLRVDGEVPTPVALEKGIAPLGHALGNFGGPIGEITSGGLLRGGGGFGGGGFGFGFPFGGGGLGGGGGFGGGIGGGGSSGGTSSNQGSSSSPATTPAGLLSLYPANGVSQSVTVNASPSQSQSMSQSQLQTQAQAQGQAQAQAQGQAQGQHGGHHGHVVPEPAAIVSALLGLPMLFLLIRRRKTTPALTV